jgi:hypothetical protein
MQNMKLVDLQTSKYLELENDWLYGGRAINISNKNGSGYYYYKQSEPQGILKTICEKIGAVVYGDRYVIQKHYKDDLYYGDIVNIGFGGYPIPNYSFSIRVIGGKYVLEDCRHFINGKIGNIFEEYSKSLRGEENRLNELMELIK